MLQRIHRRIRRDGLLAPGQHILLAVSGGADSVAMLHALRHLAPRWRLRLTVCHLDHRLRGRAAEGDADFVQALCRRLGVPCVVGRADVRALARRRGVSLEMAARAARYRFFARVARRVGADAVATAHTADDAAETVLLRLARGAGVRGLTGIPSLTTADGARVIRPLLDVAREEVLRYLATRRAAWREDASNRDPAFLRNRVRHEILPLLASRLNPRVRDALRRAAEILREEDRWLDALAETALSACAAPGVAGSAPALDLAALRRQPLAARRRVFRRWLGNAGVASEHVDFAVVERLEAMLGGGRRARAAALPNGWRVRRQGARLVVAQDAAGAAQTDWRRALRAPGVTRVPELGLRVVIGLAAGIVKPRGTRVGQWPAHASISRAAVGRKRVTMRPRRPGDRMAPLGLHGTRKVQDIFVDAKVPAGERDRVPLLECGGEIVWIPGYRVARGWEVPDATALALQITVERVAPRALKLRIDPAQRARVLSAPLPP